MSPENFCYWLQGWFELSNANDITIRQTEIIKDHLNLVFGKKTPIRKEPTYCSLNKLPNEEIVNGQMFNILYTGHTGVTAQPLC